MHKSPYARLLKRMYPSKPSNTPPVDPIEKDFLDALERLRVGEPTNKNLIAQKKKGILKINVSNVALEASRSRTLIGMDSCRYPRVRELIRKAKVGEPAEPRTYSDLVKRLRANISDLKIQVRQYQAEAGIHFLARHEAEKAAQAAKAEAARVTRKLKDQLNVVGIVPRAGLVNNLHSQPRLILIRGIPGSGKSTLARGYPGHVHLEADMFMTRDNDYVFDEALLPAAHQWCIDQASIALGNGKNVVVSNVFATPAQLQPYIDLGYPFEIVEAQGRWQSVHGVPREESANMIRLWISLEDVKRALHLGNQKK